MRVFDSKGNGFVSRAEFKSYMMNFTDDELKDKDIERLLSDADLNNDGMIDYHEFNHMILRGMGLEREARLQKQQSEDRERRDKEGGWALLRKSLKDRKVSVRVL